jgi:hypothetical protein
MVRALGIFVVDNAPPECSDQDLGTLWVKRRHRRRIGRCPLTPESGHSHQNDKAGTLSPQQAYF